MDDNLAIWNAVSKTNPAHTKHVSQRGGFTAINANSQIMEATRQFGPIGIGWGYVNGDPIFQDTLVIVPVTLWHGDRSNTFGPVYGCEEWKTSNGKIDSDAPKKAGTDGLTKCLSQLGFNADVFLGLFDDQKYVAQVKAEFNGSGTAPPAELPDTVQTMLAEIDGCDTVLSLQRWWKANEAKVPEAHLQRIVDAVNKRKSAIETVDRSAA